ncbi:MAG: DUF2398 family protein [Planctomycetota bacterium]|nr:DUF2398 family protein [Planctomycetota bacterium]
MARQTNVELMSHDVFARVGLEKTRRILNVLTEAPFFYRTDDVDLFGVLRRSAELFEDFFDSLFGWRLHVDSQLARLIKPVTCNPRLTPRQRHVFRIGGRHEYVILTLLLEFHQMQADQQNLTLDECDEVCFVLADFIEFVFSRYQEELADDSPSEERLLETMRTLFGKLEQHRFLAVRQRVDQAIEEGLKIGFVRERGSAAFSAPQASASILYALLPGIRCYRPDRLVPEDFDAKAVSFNAEPKGGDDTSANEITSH